LNSRKRIQEWDEMMEGADQEMDSEGEEEEAAAAEAR
jgi:hypothetical protein